MKALVIHQPWAWAIIAGHKAVENRSWNTAFRGEFAIVAGRSRASLRTGTDYLESHGVRVPDDLVYGAVVGTARIDDIVTPDAVDSPHAFGPRCWILSGAKPLDQPIPAVGKLSFFDLDI